MYNRDIIEQLTQYIFSQNGMPIKHFCSLLYSRNST